jgi:hypothetical protein
MSAVESDSAAEDEALVADEARVSAGGKSGFRW